MPIAQFSDKDLDTLVAIPKPLPMDYRSRLRTRPRSYSEKHEEGQLEIEVQNVGAFRIIIRKNRINALDFSVILGYIPSERLRLFRLRRYNGVHKHTNKIEQKSFRAFHVHYATQRYQESGWDIDAYAEPAENYTTVDGALELLIDQCNFMRPETEMRQPKLI